MDKKNFYFHIVILAALFIGSASALAADAVNVYSARQEALIKPLLDRFTQDTGIPVNLVTGNADALLARIELSAYDSPADVLITTDAGRLHRAKAAGLLQKVSSNILNDAIPRNYRDPDNHWFGLSVRARTIMVVKGKVNKTTVNTYESLASSALHGKICIRSSNNIYNQSLVASMIAAHGEKATLEWLRGLVDNFSRTPAGGDRDQVLAAAGGLCNVAVANTYYLAKMLKSDNQRHREAADAMSVVWPNQDGRGTHVNISGVGITRAAANRKGATEAALKLIEYLVAEPAQRWYAEVNNEYPVISGVAISPALQQWGKFKRDPLNLGRLGELNVAAVKLMDQAGWK